MTEEQLLQNCRQAAELLGWLTYHTRNSRRSDPGFPDLVLVRGAQIMFWELKVKGRQLTANQEKWRDAIKATGNLWREIREDDWAFGRVEELLKDPLVGTHAKRGELLTEVTG